MQLFLTTYWLVLYRAVIQSYILSIYMQRVSPSTFCLLIFVPKQIEARECFDKHYPDAQPNQNVYSFMTKLEIMRKCRKINTNLLSPPRKNTNLVCPSVVKHCQ